MEAATVATATTVGAILIRRTEFKHNFMPSYILFSSSQSIFKIRVKIPFFKLLRVSRAQYPGSFFESRCLQIRASPWNEVSYKPKTRKAALQQTIVAKNLTCLPVNYSDYQLTQVLGHNIKSNAASGLHSIADKIYQRQARLQLK